MRAAARRDGPEQEIIAYLQANGVWVLAISQRNVPDLLCYDRRYGTTTWLEVKAKYGKLKPGQQRFFEGCPMPCFVARTKEEALELVRPPKHALGVT